MKKEKKKKKKKKKPKQKKKEEHPCQQKHYDLLAISSRGIKKSEVSDPSNSHFCPFQSSPLKNGVYLILLRKVRMAST